LALLPLALAAPLVALPLGCAREPGGRAERSDTTDERLARQMAATQPFFAKADPQMRTVLVELMSLQPEPLEQLTPDEARRQPTAADAVIGVLQDKGKIAVASDPAVGRVETMKIPGPDGAPEIPVRVYTPPGEGPFPVVVYYHGGGWVIATLDDYDSSARALCASANAVVVSVDYRQAPEHKFPAAHEDSYAALQYVMQNAASMKGDPQRVAVVGESAGGNLAAAVCIMAKQRGGRMPVHQVLVYPIANYAFDTPSYNEHAQAKPLGKAGMQWFFGHYLNSPSDGANVIVSPARATPDQLRGLPPATIINAEIDPLRSEGEAYAQRLRSAGVDVRQRTYPGVTHEFFGMAGVLDKAKAANTLAVGRLKQAFK